MGLGIPSPSGEILDAPLALVTPRMSDGFITGLSHDAMGSPFVPYDVHDLVVSDPGYPDPPPPSTHRKAHLVVLGSGAV